MSAAPDQVVTNGRECATGEFLKLQAEIEAESDTPIADMTEAELRACAVNDPDMTKRRQALARLCSVRFAEGCVAQAKRYVGIPLATDMSVPLLRECREYIAGGAAQWGKTDLLTRIDMLLVAAR